MKNETKIALLAFSVLAGVAGLYFFVYKESSSHLRKMVMDLVNSDPSNNKSVIDKFKDLTDNKMSKQELKDTYISLYIKKHPTSNQKYQNDTDFKNRIADLSKKYNIFT